MHLLVNIATGVNDPTKVALGLLVAATALADGHTVDVFVAGDGVSLVNSDCAAAMHGVGTGDVATHLLKLRDGGAGLFASKMSAAARGVSPELLLEQGFTAAPPSKLVELIAQADRTVTY